MEPELCERCESRPAIVIEDDCYGDIEDRYCQSCYDALCEEAFEDRMNDGETLRGTEAAAALRDEQIEAMKLK
jgi:hypothetical protein